MFIHNINPILISIGPISIYYYSLAYIIGFLLAYWVLHKAVKEKAIKHLTKDGVETFMVYFILGTIIGGRLGHFLFYDISIFWTNPLQILMIWNGGMAFHGGILGGIIGAFLFLKKSKVKFYEMADKLMMPLAFALFLGRIANFINGELWGPITDVSWCVVFPNILGCRHPSQLYEAFYSILIFFILWFMKSKYKLKKGVVFWSFIAMYGLFRFIANFWREVDQVTGQVLSLIMVVVAGYFLYKILKKQ